MALSVLRIRRMEIFFMALQFYYIFMDMVIAFIFSGINLTMKSIFNLLLVLLLLFSYSAILAQKTYTLIPLKTKKINKTLITDLPGYLKGLAALYSAMGGTDCIELHCELTSALGLGKQGSDAQKNLIKKYFPDDKVAKLVIGQDCYLPPSTSSSYSDFQSLSFNVNKDVIQVNYQLAVYDHGNVKKINGPDIYIFENQVFRNKKRVLYAWTDK
jgi:hypothetical protein